MSVPLQDLPEGVKPLEFEYTNWRGVHGRRRVKPLGVDFRSTKWHPIAQWLMKAFDLDARGERDFALVDIGPRVILADDLQPSIWVIGSGPGAAVTEYEADAERSRDAGEEVRPFYDETTVAELERIRRQLRVLARSGGPAAGFAQAVLDAREMPEGTGPASSP